MAHKHGPIVSKTLSKFAIVQGIFVGLCVGALRPSQHFTVMLRRFPVFLG